MAEIIDRTTALENARELVRNGWCQMQEARNSSGAAVFVWADDAVQFCPSGAVARATWPWSPEDDVELYQVTTACYDLLAAAIREQGWDMSAEPVWHLLNNWNDEPGRTKEEVDEMFGRAIELSREAT